FYQHWDRVHNVAERRRFDQQDARELGGMQTQPVLALNLCALDLPVQLAKDKSARVMPLVKLETARPRAAFHLHGASRATRASRLHLSWRGRSNPGFGTMPPSSRPITRRGFSSSTPKSDGGFARGAPPPHW